MQATRKKKQSFFPTKRRSEHKYASSYIKPHLIIVSWSESTKGSKTVIFFDSAHTHTCVVYLKPSTKNLGLKRK